VIILTRWSARGRGFPRAYKIFILGRGLLVRKETMRQRVPVFLSINLLVLAPSPQQWAAGESPRIIEGGARCPSGDGHCPADGNAQSDGTASSPSPAPAIPSAPAAS